MNTPARQTVINKAVFLGHGRGMVGFYLLLLWLGPLGGLATTPPSANAPSLATEPPINEPQLRDPFLPLDYKPKSASAPHEEAPAGNEPKRPDPPPPPPLDPQTVVHSMIHVQGFLRQGDRLYALINGRMAAKGDVIQVQTGDANYRFLIRDVTVKNVAIEPLP